MEQPKPTKNDSVPVIDLVFKDLEERKAKGLETYGVLLQAFNGRNVITDLKEEILDSLVYLKQLEQEREEMRAFIYSAQYSSDSDLKVKAKQLWKKME